MSKQNPKVFLDFKIGAVSAGRVVFQLFADITPKTAQNFRGLCAGDYGKAGPYRLCYAGTKVVKIIDNSLIQCGDVTLQNGKGGYSIYGKTFPD